jgi:hypothetical protein
MKLPIIHPADLPLCVPRFETARIRVPADDLFLRRHVKYIALRSTGCRFDIEAVPSDAEGASDGWGTPILALVMMAQPHTCRHDLQDETWRWDEHRSWRANSTVDVYVNHVLAGAGGYLLDWIGVTVRLISRKTVRSHDRILAQGPKKRRNTLTPPTACKKPKCPKK